MRSAISIKQVNKSYGEFAAVRNLSLEVGEGCIFGLLGPNGAGKSTTIRMIVNITMPDTGEIRLFDRPMNDQLQQHIGYLPEDRGLYKRMKVGDQLSFFAELKGMEPKEATRKIDLWLERVGMTEWKDKRWDELSKGMQQKIQFVSTILHSPDLVILDEPFSGLDPINVGLLKEIVWELHKSGKTIIFSTHLMEQAEELCDEICLINRGEKILSGSIREVKRGFGWRYLAIDGEGIDEPLAQHPAVLSIEKRRDYLELSLVPEADPQMVLRDLIGAGARLTRFELVSPSLNEIFIQSIGQSVVKHTSGNNLQ